MAKDFPEKKLALIAGFSLLVAVIVFGFLLLRRPNEESFKAPGKNWNSPKKVEDYFIERLRMTPQEASEIRSKPGVNGTVDLRTNANVTLEGLIGNLYYYGFVRDENALRYALEHTKDTTPSDKAIKVGKEGTIDTNAEYRISEDMGAWEIADTLLNKASGHFNFDEYNYFFMP
jgi:hypothetical protein